MIRNPILMVRGTIPPIVELDTESSCAYIRFSWAKVAKTVQRSFSGPLVAIDYDQSNGVVGVELVGVIEVSIARLLAIAKVKPSGVDLNKTRYVSPRVPERDLVNV